MAGAADPYILNVDIDLYYSWDLKGKFVIFFLAIQKSARFSEFMLYCSVPQTTLSCQETGTSREEK